AERRDGARSRGGRLSARDRPHRLFRQVQGHSRGRDHPSRLSRLLIIEAIMELLFQQILSGLATGAIYACIALAIVMIYQAIGHLNFAQGEMAMFSTFIAWQLIQWGVPYWVAFVITVPVSFVAGVVIERVVFRPLLDAPILSQVVVFIGLLGIINSSAGF